MPGNPLAKGNHRGKAWRDCPTASNEYTASTEKIAFSKTLKLGWGNV